MPDRVSAGQGETAEQAAETLRAALKQWAPDGGSGGDVVGVIESGRDANRPGDATNAPGHDTGEVTPMRDQLSGIRSVLVPARTLQPGDVTEDGRVVLRVTPHFGVLAIRFEGDDTLWRVHHDSPVRIEVRS